MHYSLLVASMDPDDYDIILDPFNETKHMIPHETDFFKKTYENQKKFEGSYDQFILEYFEIESYTQAEYDSKCPEDLSVEVAIVSEDDPNTVLKVISHTNPKKKFDWWDLGGRWSDQIIEDDQCMVEELPPEGIKSWIVHDFIDLEGNWHSKTDSENWSMEVDQFVKSLPKDAFLTTIDYHI